MKGRQHVKGETSTRHATEKDAEPSVLPPGFTEILPPFPFKTCLGGAESSELVSRQKSTFSSDCYSFFLNNCIYVAIFGCTGSLLLPKALSRCSDGACHPAAAQRLLVAEHRHCSSRASAAAGTGSGARTWA